MAIETVAAVGSAVFKGVSQLEAGEARADAARSRKQQEEIASRERSIQRTGQVNRVLAEQIALESARGVALSSPSFFAIQQETLNQFAEDENADALTLSFTKQALEQKSHNAELVGELGFAGSLFDAAKTFGSTRVPSTSSGQTKSTSSGQIKKFELPEV